MSKKVLILVLSLDESPYDKMIQTSKDTWDSIGVPGSETIFYTGRSYKKSTDKIKYFDIDNDLFSMGKKNIAMFEWALENKEFDYVCRINASCYVNKKVLIEFIQTLPNENVFVGAEVTDASKTVEPWYWGGCSFIFSKDVIQKIVDNKQYWDHIQMEDKSISYLINRLQIPVIPAKSCTIDNMGECWRLMIYGGGESFEFTDFQDLHKAPDQFLYRVKQDGKRYVDQFLMEEIFRVLNKRYEYSEPTNY